MYDFYGFNKIVIVVKEKFECNVRTNRSVFLFSYQYSFDQLPQILKNLHKKILVVLTFIHRKCAASDAPLLLLASFLCHSLLLLGSFFPSAMDSLNSSIVSITLSREEGTYGYLTCWGLLCVNNGGSKPDTCRQGAHDSRCPSGRHPWCGAMSCLAWWVLDQGLSCFLGDELGSIPYWVRGRSSQGYCDPDYS